MIINIPVEVPDWAKWLTIDEDGTICIWSIEPFLSSTDPVWDADKCRFDELHLNSDFLTPSPEDYTKEIYKITNNQLERVE